MKENSEIASEKTFKRSVMIVAAFAAFLTPFLGSAVNLALPAIGKDLNASAIGLGWVISSFILSSAMFLLPFGRLADIIGRKKVFSAGILLFTISTFLIVFSWNLSSLIILRIIQGISGAMIFGTSLAIITSVFPVGERGRAMGINITAVYLGLISRSGNRRITDPVFRMAEHICISCSFRHSVTDTDKNQNKNRMG